MRSISWRVSSRRRVMWSSRYPETRPSGVFSRLLRIGLSISVRPHGTDRPAHEADMRDAFAPLPLKADQQPVRACLAVCQVSPRTRRSGCLSAPSSRSPAPETDGVGKQANSVTDDASAPCFRHDWECNAIRGSVDSGWKIRARVQAASNSACATACAATLPGTRTWTGRTSSVMATGSVPVLSPSIWIGTGRSAVRCPRLKGTSRT